MNAKDTVSKGYDCFSKGDMETFFNEVIHDDCVWTHPGEQGKNQLKKVAVEGTIKDEMRVIFSE